MSTIHASLLLSGADYQMYLDWQDGTEPVGMIENALNYHHFLIYRDTGNMAEPSVTTPQPDDTKVAEWCKHPIHPSYDLTNGYCPVCQVTICLQFLNAVSTALNKDRSTNVKKAWRLARLEVEDCVVFHEENAKREMEYAALYPEEDISACYTAVKAVALARDETRYPGEIMSRLAFNSIHSGKSAKNLKNTEKKKTVSFAADTIIFTNRHPSHYSRSSKKYSPGLWSCSQGQAFEDTSHMFNTRFNLDQMKIYVTSSGSIFDSWEEDLGNLPGENEGLAGNHALWMQILCFVLELIKSKDVGVREEFALQLQHSDMLIVLTDGESGEIETMYLIGTNDYVEEADTRREVKWTSHKECMAS